VLAMINWRECFKSLILLGMSFYFLLLLFSGKLNNFINPRFAWLAYLTLAAFLLLAFWNCFRLFTGGINDTQPAWGSVFLMAIPVFFAFYAQPLGADAISGIVPTSGMNEEANGLPPPERNLLDWLAAFDAATSPAELNGLPVDIVAFVYREADMNANQFIAVRFSFSCCVADAFAIGIAVEAENAQDFADGQWIRIEGSLQAGEFRGEFVPIIIPSSIRPVKMPENPYLVIGD
jgi:putative membrane protein